MCLKLITDDLYDVAARLRSVNESYVVYYNTQLERYEVHDSARNCLEFVVPYDELDARTVDYARYTRVENAKLIFAEMEKYNEKLEKEQAHKVIEDAAVAYEQRRFNES